MSSAATVAPASVDAAPVEPETQAAPVAEDIISSADIEIAQPDLVDGEVPKAAQYVLEFFI